MRNPLLLSVLLGLGLLTARAQTQVSGRVLDRSTHQPVPYASVVVAGTTLGTTSNAEGEFVLRVRQLPAKVLAFSLGYGRDSVQATQAGAGLPLALSLLPAPIQLPAAEPPSYAAQLLMRAYQQVQRTRQQAEYGQAFYRQITRSANEPTEVLEAVWDVKASSTGLDGSRLAQGRYASRSALMNFSNFSLYTKILGGFCGIAAMDTADSHAVLSADPTKYFVLRYKGVTQNGPYQLAEVAFESRPGIPAVQGSVFIELSSYQVLHTRATRQATLTSSSSKVKLSGGAITVEADFKPSPTGALPNYVKANLAIDVSLKGKPDTPVHTESFTYFYDLGPVPTGLPYVAANPTRVTSDLAAIKQKAYDATFWRDNPVVKRTPLEDEVIRSFESQKGFGTMLTN